MMLNRVANPAVPPIAFRTPFGNLSHAALNNLTAHDSLP